MVEGCYWSGELNAVPSSWEGGMPWELFTIMEGKLEEKNSDHLFVGNRTLSWIEQFTEIFAYTKWRDEGVKGVGVLLSVVLERGEFRIIIGHCLIVLRGDAQETVIIRVHYSRWVEKKDRIRAKGYILVPPQNKRNLKSSKPSVRTTSTKLERIKKVKNFKITKSGQIKRKIKPICT